MAKICLRSRDLKLVHGTTVYTRIYVLSTTYCGRKYLQRLLLLLEGATTSTNTADTDSWTKLRRLHCHQPEHVSACSGSAAMRGGCDGDSILCLARDD